MAFDIPVIVGSLRAGSFSRMTARTLASLAPPSLVLEIEEIGHLPFYNQDREADAPDSWLRFRDRIRSADGVLFVTPEYNRSLPAALKNAIDVASRPYGASAWSGKPTGVVSVSTGGMGGFGANHQLRQALVFLDMPVMQQPEAYYGHAGDFFDEAGTLKSEATHKVMQRFIEAYAAWVAKILG
jgi:chromate reductase